MWSAKYPRVKEVLKIYDEEGIDGLNQYYSMPGMEIPPDSWHERIAKAVYEGRKLSLNYELNLVIEKFKFSHERYIESNHIDELAEQEIKLQLDKLKQ